MADRIESLKSLITQDPNNSRLRYMLASEYVNQGRSREAISEFNALIELDPDYVPGYFQAGRAAEGIGELDGARSYYQQGIATARRTGNTHALGEIQAALELLPPA
ncbi:MAG: tetratricopeptide repeat protein [Bryobacterales bacterium]|nr:tetratricopeptide repeat protein [Bryobacterales bacterium]